MRKTKIICTLGPSTDNELTLKNLILNGMDVARLNMSHQDITAQKRRADMVKKIREELNLPIALLLDTKGPEIRIGKIKDDYASLNNGSIFTLTTNDVIGDDSIASITFKNLPNEVLPGSKIMIDDGLIELQVLKCSETDIVCKVINGGTVSSNKGVNVPEISLSLPFISEKDARDIKFAVDEDFDFIAASFTRSAKDIELLRKELEKHNGNHIQIIAKIENSEGIKNIDEIIRAADGIMVARGDMGVEMPIEEIPIMQKRIIKKTYAKGKHVITATQMLDSMIKNPRPTRAESTDVANAIYDGTSAIMLSGETAAGKYPVEAVSTMAKIAIRTEQDIDYQKRLEKSIQKGNPSITAAISHATCTTAHDLNAKAILALSKTGRTVQMISMYRPSCPIIGGSSSPSVLRQINLCWGAIPVLIEEKPNTDELFEYIVKKSYEKNYLTNGDLVVITAGIPLGVAGTTNLLKVHLVGNILASGRGINNLQAKAKLRVCANEEEAIKNFVPGEILVIPKTTSNILSILRNSSGIIVEEDGKNSHAAIIGFALDKPVVVGAKNATTNLKSGTEVTIDASRGLVFSEIN